MPQSTLRLVKRMTEFQPTECWSRLPRGLRGIYVLYRYRPRTKRYDVVYVGMAGGVGQRGGIRGRLRQHSIKKQGLWSHFSAYEVWDNIRQEEIKELEGLFRHIYKSDSAANELNLQRGFKKLREVRDDELEGWR